MNIYICYYNGKQVEIKGETLYDVKKKAADYFKAGKRHHMITIVIVGKGGETIKIDPASL